MKKIITLASVAIMLSATLPLSTQSYAKPDDHTLTITTNTTLSQHINAYDSLHIQRNKVLNITDGRLLLKGDVRKQLTSYIQHKQLTAFDRIGTIKLAYDQKQKATFVEATPTPQNKKLSLAHPFTLSGGTMELSKLTLAKKGRLTIKRGMIVLKGNKTAEVQKLIAAKKLSAYDGKGTVLNQYVKKEHVTMITATAHPGPLKEGSIDIKKTLRVTPSNSFTDIQRILNQASKEEGVKVVFAPGTYRLQAPPSSKQPYFTISKARNMVIDGSGAHLVMTSPKLAFLKITDSHNVYAKRFTIDYDPLPFTQGTVSNVTKQAFEVQLDKGFPMPAKSKKSLFYLKDKKEAGLPKAYAPNSLSYRSATKLADNTYKMNVTKKTLQSVTKGDRIVLMAREDGNPVFSVLTSNGVTFQDMTIYAAPGASYSPRLSERVSLLHCKDVLKKGRIHVTGADGVLTPQSHTGLWIQDSTFEAVGDDNLIVKNAGALLKEVKNEHTFVLIGRPREGNSVFPPLLLSPKDTFRIYDPKKDNVTHSVTVQSVSQQKVNNHIEYTITTKEPITDSLDVFREGSNFSKQQIWYNDATANAHFVFKNNVIKYARRYAMAIMGNDGLIENNYIYASQANAISLHNDGLFNGFAPKGTLIRYNTFLDNFRAQTTKLSSFAGTVGAAIHKVPEEEQKNGHEGLSSFEGIQDVVLERNTFQDWRYYNALTIRNANNWIVRKNAFVNTLQTKLPKGTQPLPIAIDVDTSSQLLFANNTFKDARHQTPIRIHPTTTKQIVVH
ncbi:glycosyl hydrolase family protein [Fictibacillus macauensis ZFHKF-1]|uniref:Glycosyl hydrolase family protein n=1 Tax=Fictibacillus macauensis ZFHKF-1 TaxID=1196324 RepID=I8AGQ0_9BACL|nr:right-handed parallel beta-helix repeat-containing protein [Fictibacillus macauensis]EIT84857.1 glycosyl hydrolase family protein [Fictibacillus macauensis ZFHKF-1]